MKLFEIFGWGNRNKIDRNNPDNMPAWKLHGYNSPEEWDQHRQEMDKRRARKERLRRGDHLSPEDQKRAQAMIKRMKQLDISSPEYQNLELGLDVLTGVVDDPNKFNE